MLANKMVAAGVVLSILAVSCCGALAFPAWTGARSPGDAPAIAPSSEIDDYTAAWEVVTSYLSSIESMAEWARPDLADLVNELNDAVVALDEARGCLDSGNTSGAATWIAQATVHLDAAGPLLDQATSAYQQAVLGLQVIIVIVVAAGACIVTGLAFLIKFLRKRKDDAFLARRIDHDRVARPAAPGGDAR